MTAYDQIRRSWLLTPVSQPDRIAAASESAADVIILDLVEFVAEQDKPKAREALPQALDAMPNGGAEVFVQIDPELMLADLGAAVHPGIAGVVISRAESAEQVAEADAIISGLERQRGLLPGAIAMVPALETAPGNHNGFDIAGASPRIWGLTLGRADLIMDLRPEPSGEIHLMQYLMQRLVILAAAAGKVPLGAWWRAPDRGLLATPANTLAAAQRGRAIGFKGSFCVLAEQAAALNEGFTPTAAEVAAAVSLQAEHGAATASGAIAAVITDDGRALTADIVRQAASVVAWSEACARREQFKAAARAGIPVPVP